MEKLEEFLDNSEAIFDSFDQEKQEKVLLNMSKVITNHAEKLKKLYALERHSKRLPRKTKKRVKKGIFMHSMQALIFRGLHDSFAARRKARKVPPCVGHANE
jgi:hypothetical protein